MAIVLTYASFPNSRIKPRNNASFATTYQTVCPAGVTTLVATFNINRFYIKLRNSSSADDIYYGYSPTDNASTGFLIRPYEVFEIQYYPNIYVFVPGANPVTVDVDEGFA